VHPHYVDDSLYDMLLLQLVTMLYFFFDFEQFWAQNRRQGPLSCGKPQTRPAELRYTADKAR
jgi:hypothetical protein